MEFDCIEHSDSPKQKKKEKPSTTEKAKKVKKCMI